MEIFDLVLGQVQKGCFLVVVASALTCISSKSKHRPLRTVCMDQSSSDSRRTSAYVKLRFSKTNSDIQHPFSKANSFIQTPISENKLPFFKANFDFPIQYFENKHRFFKSNSNVPLSFRTYTRLGVIRE